MKFRILVILLLCLVVLLAGVVEARPHDHEGHAYGHDKNPDRCRAKSIQGQTAQGNYNPECLK